MSRHYLREDLAQIKRYFPGAKPIALHTPFDITPKRRVIADVFQDEPAEPDWPGGALQWIR